MIKFPEDFQFFDYSADEAMVTHQWKYFHKNGNMRISVIAGEHPYIHGDGFSTFEMMDCDTNHVEYEMTREEINRYLEENLTNGKT